MAIVGVVVTGVVVILTVWLVMLRPGTNATRRKEAWKSAATGKMRYEALVAPA